MSFCVTQNLNCLPECTNLFFVFYADMQLIILCNEVNPCKPINMPSPIGVWVYVLPNFGMIEHDPKVVGYWHGVWLTTLGWSSPFRTPKQLVAMDVHLLIHMESMKIIGYVMSPISGE